MNAPNPVPFVSDRTKALRKKLITLGEVGPILDQSQLVRGWLSQGGMSVVYGPSNSGKTFFVVDLAMHVAAGADWRGCRVRGGHVVYIAAEGGAGIFNRIAALKAEKPEICGHDCFHLLPTSIDLSGTGDAAAICDLLPNKQLTLVVVDTLARAIGNGDENSARDAGVLVQNLDLIRETTGAHVLVVHHSGKDADRGARGSSALRAAVDTEIAVGADRSVKAAKQRDLPQAELLYFGLSQVILGMDADGEEVTSAIVVEAEAPERTRKALSGKDEVAMQALSDALREHGCKRNGSGFPAGREVVEVKRWREQCDIHGLTSGTSDSSARTAFYRAKDKMMDANLIRMHGDYVWRVDNE